MIRSTQTAALVCALLACAAASIHAQPVYLEGIVAQVDDEVILESELQEQLAVAQMRFSLPDSAIAAASEEILQRLIDEKVIVLEAKKQGITVTDEEAGSAAENLIDNLRETLGSASAMNRALDEEGITMDELRERYREQARSEILSQRLVQREIYAEVQVTDEDIETYFEERRDELPPKQATVRLSHVFLAIRPADDSLQRAQDKLDRVKERMDAGESFGDIARELSDDPGTRDQGGDIGWITRGTLDPLIEEVAFGLGVGEISDPFQTSLGVELVRVSDKEEDRVRIQHILVLLSAGEADFRRARSTAEDVARLARDGRDFASLADEYSDDRDSAAKGGDLGLFATDDLVPFVGDAVRELSVGETSGVVQTEQGFHVFKVTEREAGGEYQLSEIRDQLRQAIGEERAATKTEEWLTELRGRYFIRRATDDIAAQLARQASSHQEILPGAGDTGER